MKGFLFQHTHRTMFSVFGVNKMILWMHIVMILLAFEPSQASWGSSDRIKLTDVTTLTLYQDKMTTSRRSYPVPQVKCVGGSAGCNAFTPYVVQCTNKGTDGFDVQWECKTDMDNAYRFGRIEVICEGYDYPDDPYILRGSCGLEYNLDLTKEGHKNKQGYEHNYYGGNDKYSNPKSYFASKTQSYVGNMILLAMVGLLIYGFYRTCLGNNQRQYSTTDDDGSDPSQRRGGGGWFGGNGYGSPPPPPGFRPEYTADDASCGNARRSGSSGGGFWTGAATGGLFGYLLGNRNSGYTNTGYGNMGYQPGYSQPSSSGWGSSGFSSGSSFGSTGTRTASGYGGTRRR